MSKAELSRNADISPLTIYTNRAGKAMQGRNKTKNPFSVRLEING